MQESNEAAVIVERKTKEVVGLSVVEKEGGGQVAPAATTLLNTGQTDRHATTRVHQTRNGGPSIRSCLPPETLEGRVAVESTLITVLMLICRSIFRCRATGCEAWLDAGVNLKRQVK